MFHYSDYSVQFCYKEICGNRKVSSFLVYKFQLYLFLGMLLLNFSSKGLENHAFDSASVVFQLSKNK